MIMHQKIMDSISQAVLGAAVADALIPNQSKKRWPIILGALLGTLPDLDMIPLKLFSPLAQLVDHRGFSHSILFCLLVAPCLTFLFRKWNIHARQLSFKVLSIAFFGVLITHTLLDCFTSWGTQLFWPFSNYRVAFNSIFIICHIIYKFG